VRKGRSLNRRSAAVAPEGRRRSPLRRALFLVSGFLFLTLGVIGVVVPVLPTTPFLILAALCFARSSVRCYRWLLTNRVFGRYLDDYLCGRGVSRRVKAGVLVFLWAVITLSAVVFVDRLWLRVLLFVVAAGVTVHVVLLKGRKRDGQTGERDANESKSGRVGP
jgi:uncharacterized membrane protein YbaN (DUF454 family)